jgi:hypothetical protein
MSLRRGPKSNTNTNGDHAGGGGGGSGAVDSPLKTALNKQSSNAMAGTNHSASAALQSLATTQQRTSAAPHLPAGLTPEMQAAARAIWDADEQLRAIRDGNQARPFKEDVQQPLASAPAAAANLQWKKKANSRGKRIVKQSGNLEVTTLMILEESKGKARVKVLSKRKASTKKYFATLRGGQLMLFKAHSEDPAKMTANNATLCGAVEGCVAHKLSNMTKPNTFAVAFRTGGVIRPNIVFQCTAPSEMVCDLWIKNLHLAAAMHESRVTEPATCVTDLEKKLQRLEEELLQPETASVRHSVLGESARAAGRNDMLLQRFRWQCYLAAAKGSSVQTPQGGTKWIRQPEGQELLEQISPDLQRVLGKLGQTCASPAGLCLLLHADHLNPVSSPAELADSSIGHVGSSGDPPRKTSWFGGGGNGAAKKRTMSEPGGGLLGTMPENGIGSHGSSIGAGVGSGFGGHCAASDVDSSHGTGSRQRAMTKPSAAASAALTQKIRSMSVRVTEPLAPGKPATEKLSSSQYKITAAMTAGELVIAVTKKLAKKKIDDPYQYYLRYTGGTTNEVLPDDAVVCRIGQRFAMQMKPERLVQMVCPSGTGIGLKLDVLNAHGIGRVMVKDITKDGIAELQGDRYFKQNRCDCSCYRTMRLLA